MAFLKRKLVVIVIILLVIYGVYYWRNPLVPKLKIGPHVFTYETAITDTEMKRGLSGRERLPENHGMLFIYNRKEQFSFWMIEMKFPIDIIWIDDMIVADITKNVPTPIPGQQLPLYTPKKPVNRVFEVNAGTADRLNIQVGDRVEYLRR